MTNKQFAVACGIIVVILFYLWNQQPQLPPAPNGMKLQQNQPDYITTRPHAIRKSSNEFLCVSTIGNALEKLERNGDKCIVKGEPGQCLLTLRKFTLREVPLTAPPTKMLKMEFHIFSSFPPADKFMRNADPPCRFSPEGFQDDKDLIIVGKTWEINVTGKRAPLLYDNKECLGVGFNAFRYTVDGKPILRLVVPDINGIKVFVTGFGDRDKDVHRVSLDEIVLPQLGSKHEWSGQVIIPAAHAHVVHQLTKLKGLRTKNGKNILLAMSYFSLKVRFPSGSKFLYEEGVKPFTVNTHFNLVFAIGGVPFQCLHVGPWGFGTDPQAI